MNRRKFLSSAAGVIAGCSLTRMEVGWRALVADEKDGRTQRLQAWNSEYRKMKIDGTVVPFTPDSISALLALSEEAITSVTSRDPGEPEASPPCVTGKIAADLSRRYGPESRMTFELFMEIIDLEDEIGLQKIADDMEIECEEAPGGVVTPEFCRRRHLALAQLGDPRLCKQPQICVKQHLSWIGHCLAPARAPCGRADGGWQKRN